MTYLAKRSTRVAVNLLVLATILATLQCVSGSGLVALVQAAEHKSQTVKPATVAPACGFATGNVNPAGTVPGSGSITSTYAGTWQGIASGQSYDAMLIGSFNYTEGQSTGTYTGTLTYSFIGSSAGSSAVPPATWTIDSNCQGTVTVSGGYVWTFYYFPNNNQIQFLETDELGSMTHGEMQISHPTCTAADANGTWAGTWKGMLDGQNFNAMLIATINNTLTPPFSGTVTYNEVGTVLGTLSETSTNNGWVINSDCTGTLTLSNGLTFAFVLFWGNQIQFMETDGTGLMAFSDRVVLAGSI